MTLRMGDTIVRAGQKIAEKEFTYLDSLELTRRHPNTLKIAIVMISVAGAMLIFRKLTVARLYG
ncbi:MAG: hypothetical protein HC856_10245 [Pseudanabaena sp. RU_4_16]|nr:hypothetical protein [Pseudanabaena sp. RU_4_16]